MESITPRETNYVELRYDDSIKMQLQEGEHRHITRLPRQRHTREEQERKSYKREKVPILVQQMHLTLHVSLMSLTPSFHV